MSIFATGGALFEIVAAKVVINIAAAVSFVVEKGTLGGLIATTGLLVFKKIQSTAISTVVRDALPHSHSYLGKSETKQFIRIQKEKRDSFERFLNFGPS
jgi:hypothetical protein